MAQYENVIRALEWILFNFPDIEKPKDNPERLSKCINLYCQNAINLIKRLKEENEGLASLCVAKDVIINDQNSEIKKLKEISILNGFKVVNRERKLIRAEATKDLAERLCKGRVSNDPIVIAVKAELKIIEGGVDNA